LSYSRPSTHKVQGFERILQLLDLIRGELGSHVKLRLVQRSDTGTGDGWDSLVSDISKLETLQVLYKVYNVSILSSDKEMNPICETHLGQSHTPQENQSIVKLGLPLLLVPSVLSTHDLNDPW
jgi:hypothetical protein